MTLIPIYYFIFAPFNWNEIKICQDLLSLSKREKQFLMIATISDICQKKRRVVSNYVNKYCQILFPLTSIQSSFYCNCSETDINQSTISCLKMIQN